jgi:hypothetical protein
VLAGPEAGRGLLARRGGVLSPAGVRAGWG